MEKLKIGILQDKSDSTSQAHIRSILEDTTLLELCSPVFCPDAKSSDADALMYVPTDEPVACPPDATEIIVTEKVCIMPLATEPTAEDIARLRDIMERDFDCRSPRILIEKETAMQNPDLADQVTAELGINTYGPYTAEQAAEEGVAQHFDAIITTDEASTQRIVEDLAQSTAVRYFAGSHPIATAVYSAARKSEADEEGLADVSWLTHPIFTAIDIIRNRISFDEARQNILPKLFRDKREDRKREEAQRPKPNNENSEKAS